MPLEGGGIGMVSGGGGRLAGVGENTSHVSHSSKEHTRRLSSASMNWMGLQPDHSSSDAGSLFSIFLRITLFS